jgi:hypothetical protein
MPVFYKMWLIPFFHWPLQLIIFTRCSFKYRTIPVVRWQWTFLWGKSSSCSQSPCCVGIFLHQRQQWDYACVYRYGIQWHW